MNFKNFYLITEAVDRDIYSFEGSPGSIGIVDLRNGVIKQCVSYKRI